MTKKVCLYPKLDFRMKWNEISIHQVIHSNPRQVLNSQTLTRGCWREGEGGRGKLFTWTFRSGVQFGIFVIVRTECGSQKAPTCVDLILQLDLSPFSVLFKVGPCGPPIRKFDLSRKVFSISGRPTLMETELKLSVKPSQSYQMLNSLRKKDNQQHE